MLTVVAILGDKLLPLAATLTDQVAGRLVYETFLAVLGMVGSGGRLSGS